MAQPHAGDDRYEPLFETDRGRVLYCDCCGSLQLHFGNAILGLNATDFDPLRHTIRALEHDALQVGAGGRPRQARARERATLFVGDSGVGFAFDAGELTELHRLLEGARLFLELQGSAGGPDDRARSSEPEGHGPS